MILKKLVKNVLDRMRAEDGESAGQDRLLTNRELLEELTAHFRAMLQAESVGRRMLYPMSFNILMAPEDYESRKQSLPFVLPEVVAAFYGIIEEKRKEFPNFTAPAKYWFFQFSACQIGEVDAGGPIPLIVRRGHIATVASLLNFDIRQAGNVTADTNTRVSIKLDDSNVMNDVNINWDAIRRLDVLSEGSYTYPFDEKLGRDAQQIMDQSNQGEISGLAELSYSRGGRTYRFTMKDPLIHISGRNESRTGRSFFILESETVRDSHIQIRYVPAEKRFQLAAFGPARLNSRKVAESGGGNVLWHDLANNSTIFINDEISVRFEIK